MEDASFLARVRRQLGELHPAERRLGEFVRDFPGELASYSASELAQMAGVSNATVTRFVRQLGYRSYSEARRKAREESRTGSRLFLGRSPGAASGADWLRALAESSAENVRDTLAAIPAREIDEAAEAILAARKVWAIGFRVNQSFAGYLQWQASQVVENIHAIPRGGQTMGEHLVNIGADDLVVVFGLRRRVAKLPALLDAICDTGAKLLYVTDEAARPRPRTAWHFRCQTSTPGDFFDHVSVMALCYVLISRVVALAGAPGRGRLRAIEAYHDRLSEL